MERYAFALFGFILLVASMIYKRRRQHKHYGRVHPTESFRDDVERGLTSDTFDLELNITEQDTRPGVEGEDVMKIMHEMGCTFDQARLIRQQRMFKAHGIDPQTGLPLDSKAVYFQPKDMR